jgi:vitamin B12 transporter
MVQKFLSYAAAAAFVVSAQAETVQLETIEVTAASKAVQNVKDVTESVIVITSEEIEEAHVTTLEEALARLGNIAMTSNGGPGTSTSFYLRGFDSKRTLVLIDGVRYNDVTGLNGAQFQFIHLGDVKQIEIIKGAQSGVWGADASAGVINIVTKVAGEGTHIDANVEAGSFRTAKGSLLLSHKAKRFDIVAGISRYTTNGFSAAEPKKGTADYGKRGNELGWERDAYRNTTFNLKLGSDLTEEDRIEAAFRQINAHYEYDWTGADALDNSEDVENKFYTATYKHNGELHEIAAQYSLSDFNRKTTDYTGSVSELSLQDRIKYGGDAFVRIGGSYQRFEHLNSYGAALDKRYNAASAFATNYNKMEWLPSLGSTIVTESLRYDRYSDFANKTTGKIGLKQFFSGDFYLSGNIGSGYNVPSLYQLFGSYGNPDLTPETTTSYDLTLGNDHLWITGFYNEITDLIDYDFVTSAYGNIDGTSTLKGIEAGLRQEIGDTVMMGIDYTRLIAKDADGAYLARRPMHQLDASVTYYATESFDLTLQGQYIGKRYDKKDKLTQTGEYALFSAVANYAIDKNLMLYGKIYNLTDKYYQTVDGYATAGRSIYIGLSAKY